MFLITSKLNLIRNKMCEEGKFFLLKKEAMNHRVYLIVDSRI